MACTDHGKRVASITHGGTGLGNPTDFSVDETVTFKLDRPSTRKSPCASMDEYDLTATATFRDLVTPIVRGTSGTLTIAVQKNDESGNVSISLVTMRMGAAKFTGPNPFTEEIYNFQFDAGNAENIAPISVS
jgi:hypothetical protein